MGRLLRALPDVLLVLGRYCVRPRLLLLPDVSGRPLRVLPNVPLVVGRLLRVLPDAPLVVGRVLRVLPVGGVRSRGESPHNSIL